MQKFTKPNKYNSKMNSLFDIIELTKEVNVTHVRTAWLVLMLMLIRCTEASQLET